QHHGWMRAQLAAKPAPLVTCEAVLSEAFFLLQGVSGGREALSGLIERGLLEVRFDFQDEREATMRLLRKYADTPMSFADACLVRMSELHRSSHVLTLDHDFTAYRRNGRERIPLMAPW
ncbi:MAG: type II toxin-antitoxin system VapC family toxin, partial [Pseudomonadota bacterium]